MPYNPQILPLTSHLLLKPPLGVFQHSMIYFFHHHELPVILQQAQIQDLLMRNQQDGGPPASAFRVQGWVHYKSTEINILS